MLYWSMRKTQLSQFIDKEIEDIEERIIVWAISAHADTGQFDLVLKSKWKLAKLYQSGGSI